MFKVSPSSSTDYNGLLHKNPYAKVDCNSRDQIDSGHSCQYALKQSFGYYYCSVRTVEGAWFQFTLPDNYVYVTNYTLSVHSDSNCPYGPKSFIFEGSKTKNQIWKTLDDVTDSGLKGVKKVLTRPVKSPQILNSFRITMRGTSTQGGSNYELRIAQIDIFGEIMRKSQRSCLCKNYRKNSMIYSYIFLMMYK